MDSADQTDTVPDIIQPKIIKNFEPIWKHGECTMVLNESLSTPKRIDLAFNVPDLLKQRRLLTSTEIESIGYTELESDKMYWMKTPSGRKVPCAMRISADFLQKHNFIQRLAPLRAQLLTEKFKEEIEGLVKSKRCGTRFLMGLTAQPYSGSNTIQVGPVSKAGHKIGAQQFLKELTDIVSEITRLVMPDIVGTGKEDRWYQNASLTLGSRNNHLYTNVQLNYTKEGQKLEDGLQKHGGVHRDMMNDPTGLTALVSLSHLSEDYFAGRFNVTSLNLTTPLLPYEIILFPGRFFHCSTAYGPYAVPRGSPLRAPPPNLEIIPCLPKGEELFESKSHHFEWMMRFYIVNEPEIILCLGGEVSSKVGSGPQQLIEACRTASIETAFSTQQTSGRPRVGGVEHYTSLFTYTDTATNKIVIPNGEEANNTLNALSRSNTEFEKFSKDMRGLITKVGSNSSAIPMWSKCPATQGAAKAGGPSRRRRRTKQNRLRNVDPCNDDPESSKKESEIELLQHNPADLTNRLATVTSETANNELAAAMAAIGSILKNLMVHGMNQRSGVETLHNNVTKVNGERTGKTVGNSMLSNGKASNRKATNLKRQGTSDAETSTRNKKVKTGGNTRCRDANGRWASKNSSAKHSEVIETDDDADMEYEIEEIVAKRPTKSKGPLYRVRWCGWGQEWDEWKTAKELEHAEDLVDEYERRCARWEAEAQNRLFDGLDCMSSDDEDMESLDDQLHQLQVPINENGAAGGNIVRATKTSV
ncbi:uncharacterized protein LY89DRAFT_712865 [Mollisia scopiformis]|uniref:Chromo domain-containing protein n=1 Tax=Mollisia scopiformis TaxID=149040 RepID=A0A194XV40_MOLSC|nr:uncharacterized protein LY89DRAFT_712865 [Mollisia scopiformis]KUJ23899.1 hypothetical protein LY89DRAFT_712865 [Mollisia scopiformis]